MHPIIGCRRAFMPCRSTSYMFRSRCSWISSSAAKWMLSPSSDLLSFGSGFMTDLVIRKERPSRVDFTSARISED